MQPDYEIAEVLELSKPAQLKALGDAFRQKILTLLVEHSATTQELAERLKTPISTVAHHLQVLTDAGLIRVVRTRQVKALTQKYFGCTARSCISISSAEDGVQSAIIEMLAQSVRDITAQPESHRFLNVNLGYARIPRTQADAFAERLHQLIEDFEHLSTPGEDAYGFFGAIYQRNLPE